ncbi:IclR family transcriptional regulator [Kineococcus rhizosphaerae]|uniref:IclR family transcriptional regulator n=1 Tax=Kineococcus rhizosphaerae TaxID=559628 RepID=A0A2T0R4L7_9ACTN|nr:IclR family transcriptional regulator [Kineococcus rhizosphaerae]PRY15306.1 IclR family transcriptional regulator [Kineococcus rhizosphaerae]
MSQSLARALRLLDLVADGTSTLTDLAEATGSHKSTVLRLLRDLEDHGLVQHGADHRYVLGPHLFRLAAQALDDLDVRSTAAPRLRELRDTVRQTVHVAVFDGRRATYVDKLEPREAPVRMASRIGNPVLLHCTAVGKVFLAALPPEEAAALLAAVERPRLTPRTLVDVGDLLREVETVRADGWAQDHAENETFVNCVAAPVHGPDGRVLAAVSISVPDVLLPHEAVLALVPPLLSATADISRACGYRPPEESPR